MAAQLAAQADALTAYAVPGAAEAYTQMNATSFKTVNHLICDLTQVVACTVAMPLITRLKVYMPLTRQQQHRS